MAYDPSAFSVTAFPTPVLNTQDFRGCFGSHDGSSLPLDSHQLFRPLEVVLLPGSEVILHSKVSEHIWTISSTEYSYKGKYFVDVRFLSKKAPKRKKTHLSVSDVIDRLLSMKKSQYLWGGNWPDGIPEIVKYYPPLKRFKMLPPIIQNTWIMKGVDCSGMLYYASGGVTPRNTSSLVNFGVPVSIENKNIAAIKEKLKPLDLIVWRGHVICVLDKKTTIESMEIRGVVLRDIESRLAEVFETFKPVDTYERKSFVVRRWHPEILGAPT